MKEVKFSEMEKKIIKILNRFNEGLLTSKLASRVYKTVAEDEMPLNANNSVTTSIRQINKKCKRHKLDWFINGEGRGRQGKTVWINPL